MLWFYGFMVLGYAQGQWTLRDYAMVSGYVHWQWALEIHLLCKVLLMTLVKALRIILLWNFFDCAHNQLVFWRATLKCVCYGSWLWSRPIKSIILCYSIIFSLSSLTMVQGPSLVEKTSYWQPISHIKDNDPIYNACFDVRGLAHGPWSLNASSRA